MGSVDQKCDCNVCDLYRIGRGAADKLAGAAVSSWVYAKTGDQSEACLAALGVGLAKEVVDDRNGRADSDDAVVTTFGCTVIYFFD